MVFEYTGRDIPVTAHIVGSNFFIDIPGMADYPVLRTGICPYFVVNHVLPVIFAVALNNNHLRISHHCPAPLNMSKKQEGK
jgi:hypothetical protein